MKYLFSLPIGDWSSEGHEECLWYKCKANKPIQEIREAHFRIKEVAGIDIHNICGELNEDSVSVETYEKLRKFGFTEGNKEFGDEIILDPDHMAKLWVLLLQKADPELKIEVLEDEEIPTLPFYGLDEQGRYIGHVGYGLFGAF